MPIARRTIVVRSDTPRSEATATAVVIQPGFMLQYHTVTDQVRAHAVAGGLGGAIFAIENDVAGDGVSDAYLVSERIQYHSFNKGDQVLCQIANGEAIAIGDYLSSNGDGKMKEYKKDSSATLDEEYAILVALEPCDMSTSSGADADGYCWAEVI